MRTGDFPQAINLGERSVCWLESEIDSWMEARIAGPIMKGRYLGRRVAVPRQPTSERETAIATGTD